MGEVTRLAEKVFALSYQEVAEVVDFDFEVSRIEEQLLKRVGPVHDLLATIYLEDLYNPKEGERIDWGKVDRLGRLVFHLWGIMEEVENLAENLSTLRDEFERKRIIRKRPEEIIPMLRSLKRRSVEMYTMGRLEDAVAEG